MGQNRDGIVHRNPPAPAHSPVDADGASREKIFDVAWSGERLPLPDGSLPPVGNTVDEARANYSNTIGAAVAAAIGF